MDKHVILIGVVKPDKTEPVVLEHLKELEQLVHTLESKVIQRIIVFRKEVDPALFIGRGKVDEIVSLTQNEQIDEVIFDDELSPTQMRNLNQIFKIEVRDRTGIILDIFARHARTREAKTQIELATLQYILPRLTRRWTHLERQIGGIGVRSGAGETQIEVDRRLIRTRIARLKRELEKIDKERTVQKKARSGLYLAALVGYTNVGKSTIMNLFTDSAVITADKLFATLDTTVRICQLDKHHTVLLSDTVGFIRKLPHSLIASFRSTLCEVQNADLIIRVADISSSQCFQQLEAVDEVLKQLNAHQKPSLYVFNKIDCMDRVFYQQVLQKFPGAIFISALNQLRVSDLRTRLLKVVQEQEIQVQLGISLNDVEGLALLRNHTIVHDEQYLDGQVQLKLSCYRNKWNWIRYKLGEHIQFELIKG